MYSSTRTFNHCSLRPHLVRQQQHQCLIYICCRATPTAAHVRLQLTLAWENSRFQPRIAATRAPFKPPSFIASGCSLDQLDFVHRSSTCMLFTNLNSDAPKAASFCPNWILSDKYLGQTPCGHTVPPKAMHALTAIEWSRVRFSLPLRGGPASIELPLSRTN